MKALCLAEKEVEESTTRLNKEVNNFIQTTTQQLGKVATVFEQNCRICEQKLDQIEGSAVALNEHYAVTLFLEKMTTLSLESRVQTIEKKVTQFESLLQNAAKVGIVREDKGNNFAK